MIADVINVIAHAKSTACRVFVKEKYNMRDQTSYYTYHEAMHDI